MLTLAARNVFRHRTRSLISMSAISFGCICVVFMAGYISDTYRKMRESYINNRTGHLQIYRNGYSKNGLREPFKYMIGNSDEVRAALQALPHVASVTSRVEISGLVSAQSSSGPCLIQGVELAAAKFSVVEPGQRVDKALETGMILNSGAALTEADVYGTVVGMGLAHGLGVKPGDGVALTVTTEHGGLNALDLIVRGIFQTSYKPFDDHTLKIPLKTAQELMDTTAVHALVISLDETDNTLVMKQKISDLIAKNGWDLEIKDWRQLNEYYVKTENLFDHMFGVVKFVLALIVILSIYNTLNMTVLERINEIGTLRALGSSRRRILQLFVMESLVLGGMGSLLGVALGCLFTFAVGHVGIPMPPPPGASMNWVSEPFVTLTGVWAAFLLSIITAVMASVIPSFRASRLDIAEALRHCN